MDLTLFFFKHSARQSPWKEGYGSVWTVEENSSSRCIISSSSVMINAQACDVRKSTFDLTEISKDIVD